MNKLLLTPLLLLANFIVANAQIVSIPDANFKSALVGNPAINTNNDSEIQVSEAIAYSGWISVDNLGIVNLSGLSSFSNITGLSCSNNLLTSIDISNNGGVNYFYCNDNQINTLIFGSNMPNTVQCANNQLTSISLPNGSALYYLKCSNNSLTAIDVTQQFNLHILEVDDNLLSMLNLGSNYQLYDLNCAQNQITSLDISPCPLTSFNSINNPLLTCIKVANVANANSNTNWFKDVTATYSLNCATPIVSIPDPNFKSALVANPAINTNADAEIQVSEANAYSGTINVSNLNISDLTGINSFTSINHLFCANNQLTNLDVSSLSNLITLNCSFNLLTSLNLSNNLFIDDLNCGYNQIQVLDVSMLGNLHYLECTSNQLTSLNLSNSNALIDLKCGVNQLSQLDVSATTILSMLQCQSNQLTSLNLGVNTNLITLWCQYNQLTSLDISYCTALQTLTCYDNLISFFDVSLNNNLGYLSCHNNSLSCIKVANVATANAQATWYKDAQASYSQYCLNGTIPTTLTTIPEINLLVSNLTTGQNTSILGNDFTPNSTVHLLVKNSLGLTILDSALLSNSIGKISCQWLIPNSVTTGTYFIAAFDSIANYTTSPARILQVTNTSTPIIQKYITIQNPIATSTYQQGDIISISFSDKIIVANNPNTNGLISKFYSIDYRINGGTWQPISNITKKGLYNNWIFINEQFTAPTDGNYEVRVQETGNTLNEEITPIFIVTPALNLGIEVTTHWDNSSPEPPLTFSPTAISADGTARMFIAIDKKAGNTNTIQQVKITAEDNALANQTVNYVGKIKGATTVNTYTEEANNLTQNTDILTAPNWFGSYYFYYVAPDDFDRGLSGINSDKFSGRRKIKLKIETTYVGITNPEVTDFYIDIVRPPLMFVHGLGGDESTWDNLQFKMGFSGYKHFISATSIFQAGIQVNNMYKGASFLQNAQVLLGFDVTKTENSFQHLLNEAHKKGICANRVDYVCHSMGGSMIRTVINKYPNLYRPSVASNASFKNYGGGFVNKLITLNTPHNGSTGADFLNDELPNLDKDLALVVNAFYDKDGQLGAIMNKSYQIISFDFSPTDAVKDLQFFNPDPVDGGVRFNTTVGVKNHLIAGLVADNSTDANNFIQNIYNYGPIGVSNILFKIAYANYIKNNITSLGFTNSIAPTPENLRLYINNKMSQYSNPNFCEYSDIVVPLHSQLAGNSGVNLASNMSLFNGDDAMHTSIHGRLDVGDTVFSLLNANISSSLFDDTIASNNIGGGLQYKKTRTQTSDSTFEYVDTTKISILSPTISSTHFVDSIINIVVKLNDTVSLKMIQVVFQGNIYYSTLKDSMQAFQIKINPSFIETQKIIVSALYDSVGYKIYRHNLTNIFVNTLGTPSKFTILPHTKLLNPTEEYIAKYNCTYPTYVTEVNQSNPNVTVSIADTNVVAFNTTTKLFIAKDSGSTYAIVEYVGLKDTIYFKVTGMDGAIFTPLNYQEYQVNKKSNFLVYPNPASNTIYIETLDKDNYTANVSIYDITGKKVKEIIGYQISNKGRKAISIIGLTKGVYFINLNTNNEVFTTKFLIQ